MDVHISKATSTVAGTWDGADNNAFLPKKYHPTIEANLLHCRRGLEGSEANPRTRTATRPLSIHLRDLEERSRDVYLES